MIVVKKVGTESIPVIQELAQITWAVAYASIISADQISYMLDLFYSNNSLQKQMQYSHQFIVAWEEGDAVGFASYAPKGEDEPEVYRLNKIYGRIFYHVQLSGPPVKSYDSM